MKRVKFNKRWYKVTGFTKGASPLAHAKYFYPKGKMRGWHTVVNLSTRRGIAKKLGK